MDFMKKRMAAVWRYFTAWEKGLLFFSLVLVTLSFLLFDGREYMRLVASLIGAFALILCAKGHPIGQMLMIAFCVLYVIISYSFSYYGEMITYFCMSLPMAIFSLVAWIKNPYEAGHAEVRVNRIGWRERWLLVFLAVIVTVVFYFVLKAFSTANLVTSTFSVTTSFIAAYLTMRRSPFYALAYTVNDVVLIVLWLLACREDVSYLSVVMCFVAFIANDLYGFFHWLSMRRAQEGR